MKRVDCHNHSNAMRALSAGLGASILAAVLALPAMAQPIENTQFGFAGADGGNWGGQKGAVIGPPDNTCANMGAVGKVNLAYDFGFNIPGDATIIGITAYIKAGAAGGQTVGVQLASDATVDPPTTLGDQRNLPVTEAQQGNCAVTDITSVNGTLANWSTDSSEVTPAVVNATGFGMVFTKLEQAEVKVDAICMEVDYTTTTGPAVVEECFQVPVSAINVIKEVLGNVPGTDWDFEFDGDPFTLPAAGGSQSFMDLEAGEYTILETPKDGWTPSVECLLDDQVVASGVSSVDVEIEPGEVITCTFTNTAQPSSITVVKELADGSPAPEGDWGFLFDENEEFFLGDGESETFEGLASGTYNIAEIINLGYQVSVSCDNGDSGGSSVNVTVDVDEDVTCTFTNTFVQPQPPAVIPTLGQWGLIVLASLMGLITLVNLRRRK